MDLTTIILGIIAAIVITTALDVAYNFGHAAGQRSTRRAFQQAARADQDRALGRY